MPKVPSLKYQFLCIMFRILHLWLYYRSMIWVALVGIHDYFNEIILHGLEDIACSELEDIGHVFCICLNFKGLIIVWCRLLLCLRSWKNHHQCLKRCHLKERISYVAASNETLLTGRQPASCWTIHFWKILSNWIFHLPA